MANLIVVCGPQAVGKMTVAESLRDKLQYKLMINHDSIEVSDRIFGFGTPAQREFSEMFRKDVFGLSIKYDVDLIFTYVCAFDVPEDVAYLKRLSDMYISAGGGFWFAELSADIDTRLSRNETPHRLEMKPTKRNVEWSRNDLLSTAEKYRLNSYPDEVLFEHHIRIDNSRLSPDETADRIIAEFGLIPNGEKE